MPINRPDLNIGRSRNELHEIEEVGLEKKNKKKEEDLAKQWDKEDIRNPRNSRWRKKLDGFKGGSGGEKRPTWGEETGGGEEKKKKKRKNPNNRKKRKSLSRGLGPKK